mmetsp:Transcript_5816/g.26870  ORF Transcript_5816/g.26870 Transcript_5816/m.26870 type:complete len:208 (-) Transcript_5816:780-1403(-)
MLQPSLAENMAMMSTPACAASVASSLYVTPVLPSVCAKIFLCTSSHSPLSPGYSASKHLGYSEPRRLRADMMWSMGSSPVIEFTAAGSISRVSCARAPCAARFLPSAFTRSSRAAIPFFASGVLGHGGSFMSSELEPRQTASMPLSPSARTRSPNTDMFGTSPKRALRMRARSLFAASTAVLIPISLVMKLSSGFMLRNQPSKAHIG